MYQLARLRITDGGEYLARRLLRRDDLRRLRGTRFNISPVSIDPNRYQGERDKAPAPAPARRIVVHFLIVHLLIVHLLIAPTPGRSVATIKRLLAFDSRSARVPRVVMVLVIRIELF